MTQMNIYDFIINIMKRVFIVYRPYRPGHTVFSRPY